MMKDLDKNSLVPKLECLTEYFILSYEIVNAHFSIAMEQIFYRDRQKFTVGFCL
jgi:hypothetical protein